MSDREAIKALLSKLGRENKTDAVLDSPQTEFEDGVLVSLDISDLGLTSIPENLFADNPEIKRIHASFNSISEISKNTLAPLKNLEFLNLYGNSIARLPDDIFEGFNKLEWLDLRSNGLEAIPQSIGSLDGLTYLFLQNNPLSDHPDHNWAGDYHSKRDVKKFLPEFQEVMGMKVTVKKPLTREQIAQQELEKRQAKEDK